MAKYNLIDVPGVGNLKIPVLSRSGIDSGSDDETGMDGSASPEWMIKIGDLTAQSSLIDGYEDYCEVFGWYGEAGRFTNGNIAKGLFTSAAISASDLAIIIPMGQHAALLESAMFSGKQIDEISLIHLGSINDSNVKIQEIKFKKSRIKKVNQELHKLIVNINFTIRENTIFVFDGDGNPTGNSPSVFDFSKNKIPS